MRTLSGPFHRSLTRWGLGLLLAAMTGAASAAVLYAQSPLDQGDGYYANLDVPQQMADDFSLGSAASLEAITWWGGYDGNIVNNDDAFLVRLFTGIGGAGTLLQEFSTVPFTRTNAAIADAVDNLVYQYDFSLGAALDLAAGTYYLSVQNLGSSDWFWQQAASGNAGPWYRGEDSDNWSALSGGLAFSLDGTPRQIPEPGILGLLMLAGAGLALARRRKQG